MQATQSWARRTVVTAQQLPTTAPTAQLRRYSQATGKIRPTQQVQLQFDKIKSGPLPAS
jgi:hypothetical protein